MTDNQKAQLKAILEIEGFTQHEIQATFTKITLNPEQETRFLEFLSQWKLSTERKQ